MTTRIGIYPGTFDPITRGHLHIIKRASRLVDHLIVAIATNDRKKPMFSAAERMVMVREDIANIRSEIGEISVDTFDSLLMHYARERKAACIFRGLRAVSDFEYEFQMTGMNARLAPEIETVFLMASDKWQFVSSSFIREIVTLGGDISEFVTAETEKALKTKLF